MKSPSQYQTAVMGILMPVATLAVVILRFCARYGVVGIGKDDVLVAAAWFLCAASGISMTLGVVDAGLGQSSIGLIVESGVATNDALVLKTRKYGAIGNWLTPVALMLAKLSLLFFFRRIFQGKAFNWVSWITISLVTLWGVSNFFLALFQCGDHVGDLLFGTTKTTVSQCLPGEILALTYGAFDIFTDIVIILIPIYWTSTLCLTTVKKILVNCVFLFGSIATLASVVRMVVFIETYPTKNSNPDQLGIVTTVLYFGLLEIGLGIIASCLPTYGALLSDRQKSYLTSALSRRLTADSHSSTERLYRNTSVPTSHESFNYAPSKEMQQNSLANSWR